MRTNVRALPVVACILSFLLSASAGSASAGPAAAGPAAAVPASAAGPPTGTSVAPGAPKPAPETRFEVTDRYTAQRRPRVAILDFEDTNADAQGTKYGSSVQAMLVTFLKRKSQFVVVERQKMDRLIAEKQRIQTGRVQVSPDDSESLELMEKVDVFVLGSVTLLEPAQIPPDENAEPAQGKDAGQTPEQDVGQETNRQGDEEPGKENQAAVDSLERDAGERGVEEAVDAEEEEKADDQQDKALSARAKRLAEIPGPRIEIDVKLISRFDGRIIAAAQRSGPLACLRSIVERLGIALEQEFLRPYYGELTINLDEPEHVRVFLTPILPEDALDEEKPPLELNTTVTIGTDYDTVEPWTTDPTTYTIRNVLSGWYSMRIERPGYATVKNEEARWEVRKRLGQQVVYDRKTHLPLDKVDPADRRFVVRVDPLDTEAIDGNALHFTFMKQGGSIAPLVKRQYLDGEFKQPPRRVILIGGKKLEINMLDRPDEYADDERCDYFDERGPTLRNYGRTFIAAGQSFNFDLFTGGELIIEDYEGEVVPVGIYKMVLWEPSYKTEMTKIRVHAGDDKKPVKTSLNRETAGIVVDLTGPRPANQAVLRGRDTHYEIPVPLDFALPKALGRVPSDIYVTTTNIPGLDGWQRNAIAPAKNLKPPYYDISSKKDKPMLLGIPLSKEEPVVYAVVKTRFGLAGRLGALSQRPDPLADDLYIDRDFPTILNLLLYGVPERRGEERSDNSTADAGRLLAPEVTGSLDLSAFGRGTQAQGTLQVDLENGHSAQIAAQDEAGGVAPDGTERAERKLRTASDRFPRDPDLLRQLLAEHLEVLDLVVLDPADMEQLRRSSDVAAILAHYIAAGGSVFAYVSTVGEYRPVIGAPLAIENMSKRTRRLDLAAAEVDGLIPRIKQKDVKVKSRRALPEVADLAAPWRTLAYTRSNRRPRIIETGGGAEGGYVALWLDDPQAFRGPFGGTRPKVEEIRGNVERYVLQRARAMMSRRFDRSSTAVQPCQAPGFSEQRAQPATHPATP